MNSNTVMLGNSSPEAIKIYPNPVKQMINITVLVERSADFQLEIYTAGGQFVYSKRLNIRNAELISIRREPFMKSGIYIKTCKQCYRKKKRSRSWYLNKFCLQQLVWYFY